MSLPFITWCGMVGLILLALTVRLFNASRFKRKQKIVQFGSEREELFVPGDPVKIDDIDYEDSDDL